MLALVPNKKDNPFVFIMFVERVGIWSLLLSLFVHTIALGIGSKTIRIDQSRTPPPTPFSSNDSWLGQTFDVDTVLASDPRISPIQEPVPKPVVTPTFPAQHTPSTEKSLPKPVQQAPRQSKPEPMHSTSDKESEPSSIEKEEMETSPSLSDSGDSPVGSLDGGVESGSISLNQTGTFGAAGHSRGVRNLATAFTRAMPLANPSDPAWTSLPLGPAGSLDVTIEVNEERKVVKTTFSDEQQAPGHLLRLVERSMILLRAGRFSLSNVETNAGKETFRLQASISQVKVDDDEPSRAGPIGFGFSPPRPEAPGHATFTLQNGRKIDITVTILTASP